MVGGGRGQCVSESLRAFAGYLERTLGEVTTAILHKDTPILTLFG